ncbi:MAG TPA: choice-of-anchor tandem repeat GloVer-containing protein [Rhizomicrobium sp.]|jgi:hypothetical protein
MPPTIRPRVKRRLPLKRLVRVLTIGGCVMAIAAMTLAGGAQAWTYKVLHDFCEGAQCEYSSSRAGVAMDAAGNLYGTADLDGQNQSGTLFELSYDASKDKWQYTILHTFCSLKNCADGAEPADGVILDADGNLYGIAPNGGSTGHGVFFELTQAGDFQVLFNFCPNNDSCPDGSSPFGPLTYAGADDGALYDGSSPIYGTAGTGGMFNGGTAFQISPPRNPTGKFASWTESAFYSFDISAGAFGLTIGPPGTFYGVMSGPGGPNETGTAYELVQTESGWTESNLHFFCEGKLFLPCWDGAIPIGKLTIDRATGTLFGIAQLAAPGGGLIYELTRRGSAWRYTILHHFCHRKCHDGSFPSTGLTRDANGNLLGVTYLQGKGNGGSVFEVNRRPSGECKQTACTAFGVLREFCLQTGCKDGGRSQAPLLIDRQGNIWGKTNRGGAYNGGVVFELSP